MMQRSDVALGALALAGAVGAYATLDGTTATLVSGALAAGVVAGLAFGLRPKARKARVRKLQEAPRAASAAAVARFEPVRARAAVPAAGAGMAWEPGTAVHADPGLARLPLTGDALRSSQVHRTTRGKCSQCGTTLWLSARRPIRARCPGCGHTRVLTA